MWLKRAWAKKYFWFITINFQKSENLILSHQVAFYKNNGYWVGKNHFTPSVVKKNRLKYEKG